MWKVAIVNVNFGHRECEWTSSWSLKSGHRHCEKWPSLTQTPTLAPTSPTVYTTLQTVNVFFIHATYLIYKMCQWVISISTATQVKYSSFGYRQGSLVKLWWRCTSIDARYTYNPRGVCYSMNVLSSQTDKCASAVEATLAWVVHASAWSSPVLIL